MKIVPITEMTKRPKARLRSRWLAFAEARRERGMRCVAWIAAPAMLLALQPFLRHVWQRHNWMTRIEPHLHLTAFSYAHSSSTSSTHVDARRSSRTQTASTVWNVAHSRNVMAASFPMQHIHRHTAAPQLRIQPAILIWPASRPDQNFAMLPAAAQTAPMPATVLRVTARAARTVDPVPAPRQTGRRSLPPVFAAPDTAPQHGFTASTASPWPSAAAPAAQPQSINVNDITEQVIRQIDRRVIASRERMGRI